MHCCSVCRPLLFAKDFKQHVEAARLLTEALPQCQEAVCADLDLLLRWIALRMADANMQSSLKILDFNKELFAQLIGQVCSTC